MANPKFEYNTPNGGKGSLTLMKNVVFNSSMCDGIYLKTRVPASTTTTTIKLYRNYASGRNGSHYGRLSVELSEAVDEYLTIIILKSSGNESIIITPGKTTATSQNDFDSINPSRIVVYRNKGAVYDITSNTDSYIGAISHATDSYGADAKVEPTNSFTLTCNDETIYVYPLCKGFEIESNEDDKISSIHLPVFRYNGEIYYPTIKITNDKKDTISKVVGYIPDVIGDKIKEKEEITEEDAGAEDTGDYVFDPIEMPELPDFVMPELPEVTYEDTVKDIVKDSTSEAVKETTFVESKPVEDTSGGTGDSGSSGEIDYIITGGTMVKYDVKSGPLGTVSLLVEKVKGDVQGAKTRHFPIYDADGNYVGSVVQVVNADGNVMETYNTSFNPLNGGGTLYVDEETGAFTYIDNKGNITVSDGTINGNSYYKYTGGVNDSGHEVYIGEDGFPVYVYTDPDTGEKIFM